MHLHVYIALHHWATSRSWVNCDFTPNILSQQHGRVVECASREPWEMLKIDGLNFHRAKTHTGQCVHWPCMHSNSFERLIKDAVGGMASTCYIWHLLHIWKQWLIDIVGAMKSFYRLPAHHTIPNSSATTWMVQQQLCEGNARVCVIGFGQIWAVIIPTLSEKLNFNPKWLTLASYTNDARTGKICTSNLVNLGDLGAELWLEQKHLCKTLMQVLAPRPMLMACQCLHQGEYLFSTSLRLGKKWQIWGRWWYLVIFLQEVLKQHPGVFWFDSTIRLKPNGNFTALFEKLRTRHGGLSLTTAGNSVFYATHPQVNIL